MPSTFLPADHPLASPTPEDEGNRGIIVKSQSLSPEDRTARSRSPLTRPGLPSTHLSSDSPLLMRKSSQGGGGSPSGRRRRPSDFSDCTSPLTPTASPPALSSQGPPDEAGWFFPPIVVGGERGYKKTPPSPLQSSVGSPPALDTRTRLPSTAEADEGKGEREGYGDRASVS